MFNIVCVDHVDKCTSLICTELNATKYTLIGVCIIICTVGVGIMCLKLCLNDDYTVNIYFKQW